MTNKITEKYYSIDKNFLGIPYKIGGKDFSGTDCIGISVLWLKENGIDYDYDDNRGPILRHWYHTAPERLRNAILEHGNFVRFYELRKFDIVLFFGADATERFPTMGGVMIDDRHFLSVSEGSGSRVSMLDMDWKERFWGAVRLHKIAEMGL